MFSCRWFLHASTIILMCLLLSACRAHANPTPDLTSMPRPLPAVQTQSSRSTFTQMIPFITSGKPPTSCPAPAGWSPLVIQAGDTLDSLALYYNTTHEAIIQANCLVSDALIPGTSVYIPGVFPTKAVTPCGPPSGWVIYATQPGDTLNRISQNLGISVAELQYSNCMGDSTGLRVGQRVFVPHLPNQTPTPGKTK